MPALLGMAADAEIPVRRIVARRLPRSLLDQLGDDDAWQVRWEVAQRADGALLRALADDPEPDVAAEARRRTSGGPRAGSGGSRA